MTESLTDRALAEGYLRLDRSGKAERIVYVAVNQTERWSDSGREGPRRVLR